MLNNHIQLFRGFGSQSFEIECNNQDAYDLASFLFADLPTPDETSETKQYDIICAGSSRPQWPLWGDEKRLYFGTSKYRLAYSVMNEVICHCINKNIQQHAIHAGAIWEGGKSVILLGILYRIGMDQ